MNKAELKVGWIYKKKLGEDVEIVADLRKNSVAEVGPYCMIGIGDDGALLCYTPNGQIIEDKGYVGDLVLASGRPAKSKEDITNE